MKNILFLILFIGITFSSISEENPEKDFTGLGIGIQSITFLSMSAFPPGPSGGLTVNFRYPLGNTPLVAGVATGINASFTFPGAQQHPLLISAPLTLTAELLINTHPIILGAGIAAGGIISYLYEEASTYSSWAIDLLFELSLKFGYDSGNKNIFFSPTVFMIPENIKENGKLHMGLTFNLTYQFSI